MKDYAELKPLQDRLKNILDVFVECAEKANVKYMLAYGTLLGAFRHSDIIPWDNDIDVVMLRDDYTRFIEYIKTHNTPNYRLSCYEIDQSYALYAKFVRLSGDEDFKDQFTHPDGLCIDIFPLDEAYSYNKLSQRFREFRIRSLKRIVISKGKLLNKQYRESKLKHIVRCAYVLPFRFANDNRMIEKALYLSQKDYGKGAPDLICYASTDPMSTEHIQKELWLSTTTLVFGKSNYTVPKDYKEILEKHYGSDYYKMPPESLRITHGEADRAAWHSIKCDGGFSGKGE